MGILFADQDALSDLKTKASTLISADIGKLFVDSKITISVAADQNAEELQPETAAEVIATGLASIDAIHYSPKADLTRMVFNLQDMELIGTGTLTGPHRVYVDLQDIYWERDSFDGIKT